jgi:hypothetical protein
MMTPTIRELVELVENGGITTSVGLPALVKMFPDVDDENRFRMALRKIFKGDDSRLTLKEKDQVVKAFVSILKGDKKDDMALMRLLIRIEEKDLR